MRDHIRFIFRGKPVALAGFSPTRSVLDWLREDNRATGTKEGCNEGDCGACTAVIARVVKGRLVHMPINTCITFVGMLDGAELITVEDLAEESSEKDLRLHPIQQAMVDHHGSQCGFCTPGIVMSLFAMDKAEMAVTRAAVNDQLSGNLCRCTGYRPIIDAALASVGRGEDRFDRTAGERTAALVALDDGAGALVGGDAFFAAPRSLAEVLVLFGEHPDATILAGATDVGLWITKQFRPVTKLIWLGRVAELQGVSDDGGMLRMGAGVTHADALPHLVRISPDLGELGRRFGSMQVRAQGTVGGNIANGSPIGDWAPAFIALGAEVELVRALIPSPCGEGGPERSAGSGGGLADLIGEGGATPSRPGSASPPSPQGGGMNVRTLFLEAFFIAYGKQDRQRGEIVSAIAIPKPGANEHFRCFKLSKRFDEDISALMGAFKLTVSNGHVTAARIAFGGMAATPKRAPLTEEAMVGASLADRTTWDKGLAALAEDYQPIDDMRASAAYRARAAKALLTRALIEIGGGSQTRLHAPTALAAE